MLVDVDKAVALAVLAGGEGDAVDAAPRSVAHQIHAVVRHGLHHLFHVGAQVVDAVVIVDAAVLFHLVVGAETIFHDKQWLLVALVQFTQRITQAHRVNLPAPVGRLDVWVRHAALEAGNGVTGAAFRFDRVGHVIAET